MNNERLICVISYWSLALGSLLAGATVLALPLIYFEPRMPRHTATVLFVAAIILLGLGFHCLDRRDAIRRTKSL